MGMCLIWMVPYPCVFMCFGRFLNCFEMVLDGCGWLFRLISSSSLLFPILLSCPLPPLLPPPPHPHPHPQCSSSSYSSSSSCSSSQDRRISWFSKMAGPSYMCGSQMLITRVFLIWINVRTQFCRIFRTPEQNLKVLAKDNLFLSIKKQYHPLVFMQCPKTYRFWTSSHSLGLFTSNGEHTSRFQRSLANTFERWLGIYGRVFIL